MQCGAVRCGVSCRVGQMIVLLVCSSRSHQGNKQSRVGVRASAARRARAKRCRFEIQALMGNRDLFVDKHRTLDSSGFLALKHKSPPSQSQVPGIDKPPSLTPVASNPHHIRISALSNTLHIQHGFCKVPPSTDPTLIPSGLMPIARSDLSTGRCAAGRSSFAAGAS